MPRHTPQRTPQRAAASGALDPFDGAEPEQMELLAGAPSGTLPATDDATRGVAATDTGWRAPAAVSYLDPGAMPSAAWPDAPEIDDDLPFWLAFNRVKGIGPARFGLLLGLFTTARAAWEATPTDWRAAGLDERTSAALARQRCTIEPAAELERLGRLRVQALTLKHAGYPNLLREIAQPPPVLYVRGTLTAADDWAVAIVGTRRATAYGRQVTERLAGELAAQNITIVSGLARGIDTHAHTAALAAGGRTIAVQGCGPDLVYPPENARLAARIVEQGAIVTEFAPGTQPEAGNFPARNRLISGLCLAVLVTEAPEGSGALITTRFAAEQGRDVLAVPGNITARSSVGSNRLIQDGARLVLETADILEELNLHLVPQQMELREVLPENATEGRLLDLLAASGEPLHADELCRASGLPIAEVSSTLVMLELKGLVRQLAPMTYVRGR
ncbi:MAG TPA: DNA-processing protein DprA, partial [Ktedonobacterales bacterium]|jgi:DNA processing protein|nr:DNA-processing protein DprA [Ktedonobacterales bacterium]